MAKAGATIPIPVLASTDASETPPRIQARLSDQFNNRLTGFLSFPWWAQQDGHSSRRQKSTASPTDRVAPDLEEEY